MIMRSCSNPNPPPPPLASRPPPPASQCRTCCAFADALGTAGLLVEVETHLAAHVESLGGSLLAWAHTADACRAERLLAALRARLVQTLVLGPSSGQLEELVQAAGGGSQELVVDVLSGALRTFAPAPPLTRLGTVLEVRWAGQERVGLTAGSAAAVGNDWKR